MPGPISVSRFRAAADIGGRITLGLEKGLENRLTLRNSPRNWRTRVVGWLKGLPGIRNFGSVRSGRQQKTLENKMVMQSFNQALSKEFGELTGRSIGRGFIDLSGRTSLTRRRIKNLVVEARNLQQLTSADKNDSTSIGAAAKNVFITIKNKVYVTVKDASEVVVNVKGDNTQTYVAETMISHHHGDGPDSSDISDK